MEINVTKIAGCEVNVIFVGSHYYFHSSFYGLIGIAERKGYDDEDMKTFILRAGTANTCGGSCNRPAIISAMKRTINKGENKYVTTKVNYIDTGELCNHGLRVETYEYR
ncbi:MAG: hypothetical protein ACI4TK_17385 [Agathobacter sp.]